MSMLSELQRLESEHPGPWRLVDKHQGGRCREWEVHSAGWCFREDDGGMDEGLARYTAAALNALPALLALARAAMEWRDNLTSVRCHTALMAAVDELTGRTEP